MDDVNARFIVLARRGFFKEDEQEMLENLNFDKEVEKRWSKTLSMYQRFSRSCYSKKPRKKIGAAHNPPAWVSGDNEPPSGCMNSGCRWRSYQQGLFQELNSTSIAYF